MRWADALKETGRAVRKHTDDNLRDGQPNMILVDPKFPKAPKLFRVLGDYGWRRVPLREADNYDDWTPAKEVET